MQINTSLIKRTIYTYQIFPVLAALYRFQRRRCPKWLLRALWIADPLYRTNFFTLARIVDSINDPTAIIAECGIYRGSTLLGMAHRLWMRDMRQVKLIGFDSFEGFPEPGTEDALLDGTYHSRTKGGYYNDTRYGEVAARISLLGYSNNIRLIKGYFEDTLNQFNDVSFSVVHLDCDLYQSYMTCLKFFYPRSLPGAYIVFDDYEVTARVYPGAQKAIDSFLADKPEKLERFADAANPRYFIRKL